MGEERHIELTHPLPRTVLTEVYEVHVAP